ncbi:SufD family Fe-S cluster assembly protein [Sulfurimonas hydrogeniphila]|uniref:SufD family Fe-S cluster assembly protein n=1 Tax=Sulfurimonas hydrogeniphila TaxID=2509341 RepID=UPI00165F0A85|nr:SufD family Fe-S cluster assembly protein [Sulfurimonas hydrogeniphila]
MKQIVLANILANLSSVVSQETAAAASRLQLLGLPTKKTEQYRYFPIEKLLNAEYRAIAKKESEIEEADFVEIVDGVVVRAPKGLKIGYTKRRTIAEEHFDPLYYLGHLLSLEVIEINFENDSSIKILHRYTQENALIAYRVVVQTAPNIKVTLSESFIGCDAKESLVLYGCDIRLQRDTRFTFIKDETLVEGIYIPVHSHYIELAEQSSADFFSFDFGNADGLQLIQAKLMHSSDFRAHHLLYTKGESKRGTVSQIVHAAREAKSSQKAKTILGESGRGIFDALIKIKAEGSGTKAYQNSQAVLLNDGAYMASKPQLEIYIDDVEASHGSTIGELDAQQLFYLRSRGIMLEEARKMLILAFANEIIDAIEDEKTRENVHLSFEKVYYGHGQLECIATCHHCCETVFGEEL